MSPVTSRWLNTARTWPRVGELSVTGRHLLDRRNFLGRTATGLGAVALANLLARDRLLAAHRPVIEAARPYAPRPSPSRAKARNVLVIFCAGAVSQLETWDYKPELIKQDGKPLAGGPPVTFQGPAGNLARPQYPFRPRGESGKMIFSRAFGVVGAGVAAIAAQSPSFSDKNGLLF